MYKQTASVKSGAVCCNVMWNSTQSKQMAGGYVCDTYVENFVYASPVEGGCESLPEAYIEPQNLTVSMMVEFIIVK